MTETLKNELCNYLGQLMHEFDNEFDLMIRSEIAEKINAVNILLKTSK